LRSGKRPPTTDQAPDGPVTHLSKNNFKATPRQLTDNPGETDKLKQFYFQSSQWGWMVQTIATASTARQTEISKNSQTWHLAKPRPYELKSMHNPVLQAQCWRSKLWHLQWLWISRRLTLLQGAGQTFHSKVRKFVGFAGCEWGTKWIWVFSIFKIYKHLKSLRIESEFL